MPEKSIVEVVVKTNEGRVPVGLMNAEQAMELEWKDNYQVSHPNHVAGETEVFLDRSQLQNHLEKKPDRS